MFIINNYRWWTYPQKYPHILKLTAYSFLFFTVYFYFFQSFFCSVRWTCFRPPDIVQQNTFHLAGWRLSTLHQVERSVSCLMPSCPALDSEIRPVYEKTYVGLSFSLQELRSVFPPYPDMFPRSSLILALKTLREPPVYAKSEAYSSRRSVHPMQHSALQFSSTRHLSLSPAKKNAYPRPPDMTRISRGRGYREPLYWRWMCNLRPGEKGCFPDTPPVVQNHIRGTQIQSPENFGEI